MDKLPAGQENKSYEYSPDKLFVSVRDSPVASNIPRFTENELKLLVDLLKSMLQYEPEKRITAQEALGHAFFNI